MPRLASSLANTDGMVDVKMRFDIDQLGTAFLEGNFKTQLVLFCERCSEPMNYDVDVHCLLGILKHEGKVPSLGEQYEPWIVESNDPINPASVVEDELILALPLVPRHDTACLPEDAWYSGEQEVAEEKPASPFSVLSSLKTKK
jgi:uncharacterized protein